MTGHFTTEAIVLNSIDYGESDRIVTFYTLGFGKVKGIAKGAKNSRKRFVNNLEPFSYIKLLIFQKENRDLSIIEQADIIRRFDKLVFDIERLAFGSYCLELLNEMTLEGQRNQKVFELLVKFLVMLNEGANLKTIIMFFKMKLLSLLGYHPHLDTCVSCKNIPIGSRVFFSSAKSGIVCSACKGNEKSLISVSPGTIKFLVLAARTDIEKVNNIDMADWAAKECEEVMGDFLTYQLGKELKSKRFLDKIQASALGGGNGL
ncbi:MAG: DNA repair protein RecO [Deltaproteobacteria bacterium RIFCSPLOWO2_12_FULL_43_16]|nr:MAG: DNA repair protein RecO [Deltaproteobacteria bacterium GWA2_43_19]OGQ10543.1 MAG: DNA repair protein RecO [Deltaproteobacteria bacterium RIFCSPHIGHO2_02_FULL_43_33]OGQ40416.1 MAG: DNA repair protein RecO [Deltaproteobacteria bacterium RIFCSPLOWO2_01_FULL_42_9]OGQ59564.1 MAG: DNA repair protein RecO [Deltaproteobacteria bacterium RIFCSPLOWO2_12_FULL_43_16]HBR18555.1 DNA repair protein RecO [Deltaproteobacteria bacterium]